MASLACVGVLLFMASLALIKASKRNLVGNKGELSVKCQIDVLNFVVHPSSQHICRVCLGILKQIEGIDWNTTDFLYPILATKNAFLSLKISTNYCSRTAS